MLPYAELEKYCSFIKQNGFQNFAVRMADMLDSMIKNERLNEPQVVKGIVQRLNGLRHAGVCIHAAFIHQKPYVRFYDDDFAEKKAELGDLIFIVSVIHKKKKIFERMTINQAKKGPTPKIDAKQLFLLSHFPAFRLPGKWGGKVYALPNYSHCLGSHSLLGNKFTFISSVLLDYALRLGQCSSVDGLRKWFTYEDFLFPYLILNNASFNTINLCISKFVRETGKVGWWERLCLGFFSRYCQCWRMILVPVPTVLNIGYTWTAEQFVISYLLSWIGEIVWENSRSPNLQAWVLIQDIVNSMAALGDEKAKEFVQKFREFSYRGESWSKKRMVSVSNNGENIYGKSEQGNGGFGIIYTEVNLDEIA